MKQSLNALLKPIVCLSPSFKKRKGEIKQKYT